MQILPWLPGYMWDGRTLKSTGAALPPTQHINPKNGELTYYCLPLWGSGAKVGLYVRHLGIVEALA
jgi:hypothetical protein